MSSGGAAGIIRRRLLGWLGRSYANLKIREVWVLRIWRSLTNLLAKQAARILNNPDSLLAQVLKQRYFRNNSFMKGGLGSRPSFAWRSIIHGRDLLQQGLVKKIGNGMDTKIWWDHWIIDGIPRVPEYIVDYVVDLTLNVNDLMDQQGRAWNMALILDTFSQKDAEIILKLKPNADQADEVCWGFSKNRDYTTKSGYAVLDAIEELNLPHGTTIPHVEKQLWLALWKSKTSPKLKTFPLVHSLWSSNS